MREFDYKAGDIIRAAVDYRVLYPLGAGGMGEVYAVEHCQLPRRFAVKLLRPHLAGRTELADMFVTEGRTVACLGTPDPHEGIVEIVDLGRTKDRRVPYMVMPLLMGETLQSAVRREGRLPILQAIGIMTRVCKALYHAHERGVVHRDVKPENIFVTQPEKGIIQVLDWGISKLIAQADDPTVFLGTPAWASKEQLLSRAIGPAADVYSAGAVLFRCLTGAMPFGAYGSSLRDMLATTSIEAPSITRFGDFPRQLSSLVARMLAKEASQRPRDAFIVAHELQDIADAIRRARDPYTHVTDRVDHVLRDPMAVQPEHITAAQIAPGTVEDPDIPRRVAAEHRRRAAMEGSGEQYVYVAPGGRHVLSPPEQERVSSASGFEPTEERRSRQHVTMPMRRAPAAGAPQARAENARREAVTNLPGPLSAPLGPSASVHYVGEGPFGARGKDNDTIPSAPPRMTVPMRSRPQETQRLPVDRGRSSGRSTLADRARARYRWLFGSSAWRDVGRPMAIASVVAMVIVLGVIRLKDSWPQDEPRAAVRSTPAALASSLAPAPSSPTVAAAPAPTTSSTVAAAPAPTTSSTVAAASAPTTSPTVAAAPAPTTSPAVAQTPARRTAPVRASAPPPSPKPSATGTRRPDFLYVDFDGDLIAPAPAPTANTQEPPSAGPRRAVQ